jgi:hypothetical protein
MIDIGDKESAILEIEQQPKIHRERKQEKTSPYFFSLARVEHFHEEEIEDGGADKHEDESRRAPRVKENAGKKQDEILVLPVRNEVQHQENWQEENEKDAAAEDHSSEK